MSVLIKNGHRYGGAGTMTYTELSDKPSINNVTLSGNKSAADLKLAAVANGQDLTFYVDNGKVYLQTPSTPIVSFSTATDAEIAAIVESYYNGEHTLAEIQEVWSVGDTRTVALSNIETVTMAIADFDKDTLVTPINGKTKALVTLTQVNSLTTAQSMNSTDTNVGSWDASAVRTYCNGTYYNAIPSTLKAAVKQVQKITAATYDGSTNQTTNDYCWLLAIKEVYGGTASSAGYESNWCNLAEFNALSQYAYYVENSERIKHNGDTGWLSASDWWTRSPFCYDPTYFCGVGLSGSSNYNLASSSRGIAPCWCL